MQKEIKEMIEEFEIIYRRLAKYQELKVIAIDDEFELQEAFRRDFIMFLLYLAHKKGGLTENHIRFINIITGSELNREYLDELFDKYNVGNEEFCKRTPNSVRIAFETDIHLSTLSILTGDIINPITKKILHIFMKAGIWFMALDEDASDDDLLYKYIKPFVSKLPIEERLEFKNNYL